jgi:hypothetical protein
MTAHTEEITWVAEHRPEVPEPDGPATERARLALMRDISAETEVPRRRWLPWLAASAGAAAVAAAGVALLMPGRSHPGPASARHVASATTASTTASPVHDPHPHVTTGTPVLLHLAHAVSRAPALPGNATLVVHHNVVHGAQGHQFSGDDLYEDDGDYYYGDDLSQLSQALAEPSSADSSEGKVIDAAAASADVSPAQAAQNVYAASPAPSDPAAIAAGKRTAVVKLRAAAAAAASPAIRDEDERRLAEIRNAPDTVTQGQRDNYLWMNISTALEGGAGRSDVRAGALLAASQLPDVTVAQTTFGGQPVLQVTNSEFSDGYTETYDLDPQTGVLIHFRGGSPSGDDGVDVTYQVSRVSTPDLTAAH